MDCPVVTLDLSILTTSATIIGPFFALQRLLFGNTHDDCQGSLQLEEAHAFAFKTFFEAESLCIEDLVRNSHWTIDHALPYDSNSSFFFFVYDK